MPANINSMAYAGEVPWHRLGTKMKGLMTSEEALTAGGLDWEVELAKMYANEQDPIEASKWMGVVRKDTHKVLVIVGKRYAPLQNKDAFKFFDEAINERKAKFETVGALDNGEKVWLLAKVADGEFSVLPNDFVEAYLLLFLSHDGSSCVTARFTPIRVVCQNTLASAMNMSALGEVKIKHIGNVGGRLESAGHLLRTAGVFFNETQQAFASLAKSKVNGKQAEAYISAVIKPAVPNMLGKENSKRLANSVERIMELAETGVGAEIDGVRGSLWGYYNAVTEWVDHHRIPKGGEANRIKSIWFGNGNTIKRSALTIASRFANGQSKSFSPIFESAVGVN